MATLKQVIECAEQVVQGREDFVYVPAEHSRFPEAEMCSYSNKAGAPSCIVGQIMYRLDPELFRRVAEYEEHEGDSFMIGHLDRPTTFFGDPESKDALNTFAGESDLFLTKLQTEQDSGTPWGKALEIAKEVVA